MKIVKEVKARLAGRGEMFVFSVVQTRTKFKACISACKKASMTRRCGSGIANFMEQQPPWFKKLYPLVESRDSCNPDMALEPTFADEDCLEDSEKSPCSDQTSTSGESTNKDLFVPVPPKRAKHESTNNMLKEAISAFNNFASKDPTESFYKVMKEENEKVANTRKKWLKCNVKWYKQFCLHLLTINNSQHGQELITINSRLINNKDLHFPTTSLRMLLAGYHS